MRSLFLRGSSGRWYWGNLRNLWIKLSRGTSSNYNLTLKYSKNNAKPPCSYFHQLIHIDIFLWRAKTGYGVNSLTLKNWWGCPVWTYGRPPVQPQLNGLRIERGREGWARKKTSPFRLMQIGAKLNWSWPNRNPSGLLLMRQWDIAGKDNSLMKVFIATDIFVRNQRYRDDKNIMENDRFLDLVKHRFSQIIKAPPKNLWVNTPIYIL